MGPQGDKHLERELFSDSTNVSLSAVKEQLEEVTTINASPKQAYDKLRSLQ